MRIRIFVTEKSNALERKHSAHRRQHVAGGFLCAQSFVDSNFQQTHDTKAVRRRTGQGGQYAHAPHRV